MEEDKFRWHCSYCGHKFSFNELKQIMDFQNSQCPDCGMPVGTPSERESLKDMFSSQRKDPGNL